MTLHGFNKKGGRPKSPWRLISQLGCVLFFLLLMGIEAFAAPRPDLMLRLASEADSAYLGAGVFEETALLQSRSQAAYPGVPGRFRILLKNVGDEAGSFLITGPGSGAGFSPSYRDEAGVERVASVSGPGYRTPVLSPGAEEVLFLEVTLTQFTLGASYRVAVTAAAEAQPGATDQVKAETVACGPTAAVTVTAPPDGRGFPGSVVYYPYTVTNVGNGENAFALSLEPGGWQGVLVADDGAGGGIAGDGVRQPGELHGCSGTGPLPAGGSYRFFAALTVPASGVDGASSEALLQVAGRDALGTDRVRTSVMAAVVTVADGVRNLDRGGGFAASADAAPGELLQYRLAVTNSGSAPATEVSVDSAVPSGLEPVPGSLKLALGAEGEGEACPASTCGWATVSQGNLAAHLGEGGSESAGGSLPPGSTIYLFFKARLQ